MFYCNSLEPAELPSRSKSVERPRGVGSIVTQYCRLHGKALCRCQGCRVLLVLLRAVSWAQPPPTTHSCPSCPQTTRKLAEDIVKASSASSLVMVTLAVVKTASWCVRGKRKGQCPAAEHEETLESKRKPRGTCRKGSTV